MTDNNCTAVTEFIILGLTADPNFRVIIFVTFLGVYGVTLVGNLTTITLIRNSSQLHTPMYLFLSHLAFVDIGYSSSVTPVMLKNFLVDKTVIPIGGCVAQMFFATIFGTAECFLLAVMAYDRNCCQLHIQMYLFLNHLAFVDIGYSSSVTPVMLKNFLVDTITTPLEGCVAQMFYGTIFGMAECILLVVTAYD
ncbi:olfactory receptor 5p57-like [Notamacropus eugenii]|uniref:olfactory receptor 5p57-like n=1 Tax=Notamacropus eugenii TaxID=9315 RepID=UPI003B67A212